jgi:MFS family permease
MSLSMKSPLPMSRWNLGALLASSFIVALGYGIVLPVLPTMVERLAGSTDPTFAARHIGFLTAAYVAASLVVAFLWGRVSDLIGRRPVLVVGLIGFAVTLAASALAPNLLLLYVGRILNGGFAAAVVPTARRRPATGSPAYDRVPSSIHRLRPRSGFPLCPLGVGGRRSVPLLVASAPAV